MFKHNYYMKSVRDTIGNGLDKVFYPLIEMGASARRALHIQSIEFTGALIRYDIGDQLENDVYVNIRKRKTSR